MKKALFTLLLLAAVGQAHAQKLNANHAHSHNDYNQNIPFLQAYHAGAGSIEADVFLLNGKLYVAHDRKDITDDRTLTDLYLKPLVQLYKKNGNRPYADTAYSLQLVIDIKEDYASVIPQLIKELQPYIQMFNYKVDNKAVRLVLSGDMPQPPRFFDYPDYIYFDGRPNISYTGEQLKRIAMISDELSAYTAWSGKGILTAGDSLKLRTLINDAHSKHKPFRFWATKDGPDAWLQLEKLGTDWINTDVPQQLHDFFTNRDRFEYVNTTAYKVYQPTYKTDGSTKKPKNIILLIGDGMGPAQIQAGLTANHGQLNMAQMKYIGFSQTRAANTDNTDSAAGATAMACGQKTNNRYVGVSVQGKRLTNLPDTLAVYNIKSGIISSGDITDATPAAFYAHNAERSSSSAIANDFLQSHADVLIGSNRNSFLNNDINSKLAAQLEAKGYKISTSLNAMPVKTGSKQIVLLADSATRPVKDGRGNMLAQSLKQTINLLKNNKKGFFIMAEGAQIDYGGHANDLPYVVTELHDFDKTIAEALKFADENGETLVIVTADHETGGLTLLDANTAQGMVLGNFSTNGHTGINVPVFAYGPGAGMFTGTYQNTAIFHNIVKLLAK